MAKVSCNIGVTLQIGGTDSRNFIRLDMGAQEVDVEFDPEGKLTGLSDVREALTQVFDKLNEELSNKIEENGLNK